MSKLSKARNLRVMVADRRKKRKEFVQYFYYGVLVGNVKQGDTKWMVN